MIARGNGDDESDLVGWTLLLLTATVRSFAHMLLGISNRNTILSTCLSWCFVSTHFCILN